MRNKIHFKPFKTRVMKKLNFITTIVLVFFFSVSVANATDIRSPFSKYEIVPVENIHLGTDVKGVWTIRYNEADAPITVMKRSTKEGAEYVVQSDYFVVSYGARSNGFGCKATRKAWCTVPQKITRAVINVEEMDRQKVLTPNKNLSDDQALGLIASYLPDLLNDGYTHLLN